MRTGTPSSAAELLDELGGVEVVLQPRDAVAIELEQRERPHRLAVDVLVPVHEDKPIAMRGAPRRAAASGSTPAVSCGSMPALFALAM